MPSIPWVQWQIENIEEIERFLEPYQVYTRRIPGNQLLVLGIINAMSLQLSPGDCLVLHPPTHEYPHDRLGVIRVPESVMHRESDPKH